MGVIQSEGTMSLANQASPTVSALQACSSTNRHSDWPNVVMHVVHGDAHARNCSERRRTHDTGPHHRRLFVTNSR